jgi:hypothetical protein
VYFLFVSLMMFDYLDINGEGLQYLRGAPVFRSINCLPLALTRLASIES